jgi:phage shock protein PspC (stress-responsive transcriptional regulator)
MAATKNGLGTEAFRMRMASYVSHVRYEHLVAGVSGGVASTLILHPLDLIKIRFAGKFCFSLLTRVHLLFMISHYL